MNIAKVQSPRFSGEWEKKYLWEIGRFSKGRGIKRNEVSDDGVPCIRYGEIYTRYKNYVTVPFSRISLETAGTALPIETGDILFAGSGETTEDIGRCVAYLGKGEAFAGGDIIAFRPSEQDSMYLGHLLNCDIVASQKARFAQGDAVVHISARNLAQIEIELAPPDEQRAIASVLFDIDGLLGALESLILKKRAVRQATMQLLLTGEVRLPGFSGDWMAKRIEDIADIDPENLSERTNRDRKFNYISLENVDAGQLLDHSELEFGSAPSRARRVLRPGDVMMSTVRPNLKAHLLYLGQVPDAVCSTGFAVLRFKPGLLSPGFLFAHLFAHTVNAQIEKLLAGSNYPAINSRDVRQIEIPCPPEIDEQYAIARVLSDMEAEIGALYRRLAKARSLKLAVVQQLLTGRVRLVKTEVDEKATLEIAPVVRKHNWQFNEAVVISVLARNFGSDKYPLGRMRCAKLAYLLHRREEGRAEGYLKKAAGPYNPATRYGGPERIALDRGYVRRHKRGRYQGFVAGDHFDEAEQYFDRWYGTGTLQWLEQFRFKKNDELELLTTVDMAVAELRVAARDASVENLKEVIRNHPEWQSKLNRSIFSDGNLAQAIESCRLIFDASDRQDLA